MASRARGTSTEPRGSSSGGGGAGESRVLFWTVATLAAVYVAVRFGVPWLAVILGLTQTPAPVPAFALGIYMICAVVGAFVYASSDEERWRAFLAPIARTLVLPAGPIPRRRLLALAIPPLLVGWLSWGQLVPSADTPAVIRVQHPGLPERYAEMSNPVSDLSEPNRDVAIREGTVLYQKNCRPCHGTKADGNGPLARGLRLRPVDFTDPGTIATVVEQYPFWRIDTGGPGLPDVATPWNSSMPAWGDDLEPEEIWRIIMAEHRIAGTEARNPEGAHQ